MTFAEMKTETFRRLEENSAAPVFWTEADVETSINEGHQEISNISEWEELSFLLEMKASTTYYNLFDLAPGEFLRFVAARNEQTNQWLNEKSVRDLDANWEKWETNDGEPQHVFIRGLWWLGVHPRPSTAGGLLKIYYKAIASPMTIATQEPAYPREYHYGPVNYALYDLFAQDRETAKALHFWRSFQSSATGLKSYVEKRMTRDRVGAFNG